ncbi:MAG: hypothetical protein J5482_00210 [Oscillospiraceae bacterium]|nr:hypothetical protein [Oscillospiraceae bacterium]
MNHQSIEDILAQNGIYVSPTVGVSMRPMLRQGKDRVILMPPQGRLKKYDVPLYRRGKDYVLHRIVAVRPDDYVVLGDNCIAREYVRDEQIIGVLTGFYRGERYVKLTDPFYRAYRFLWQGTWPLRRLLSRVRSIAGRVVRRIIR